MPESFKVTLKAARELSGYKQHKAAKLLNISADTLSNWERERCFPKIPQIQAIEKLYEVTYNQIILNSRPTF